MTRRYTSQGTSWVVEPRPDRNRVRTNGARFERPKGETSWIVGVAITIIGLVGVFAVMGVMGVMW